MGRITMKRRKVLFRILVNSIVLGGLIFSVVTAAPVREPGPAGRPVPPLPSKNKADPLKEAARPLSPGPPILTPPVARPGPLPGTVLVPGTWQGNRWVPGRLEKRSGQPLRWVPGHFTDEGRWIRGHWE